MNGTLQIRYEPWIVGVIELSRRLGKDLREVVKDEARLWTAQAMRLTPPKNASGLKGSDGKKLKPNTVGENGVRLDIIKSATPADPDWPDAPKWMRKPSIRKIIIAGDRAKFEKIIKNFGAFQNWSVAEWSPALHQSQRNARGRVGRSARRFIIGTQQLAQFWAYLVRVVSHVGRLKAGFGKPLIELGGKSVPLFVRRHIPNARGFSVIALGDGKTDPSIMIVNHAIGVGNPEIERICRDTFTARAEAMKRRCYLIVRGYSKDSVSRVKTVRSERGNI